MPISAEDFARARRRKMYKWIAAAVLLILLAVWVFRKSSSTQDSAQNLSDGEELLKKGRYAEAIQSLDRALAAQGGLGRAYLLRGRANAALEQNDAAIRDFTNAAGLQPASGEALVERAAIRLGNKDYQAAISDCAEAVQRDPKLPRAYMLRGMAMREKGSLAESLTDFDRAVELSPDVDTYFQRATTYQLLGKHSEAIADLDHVVMLLPGNPLGYLARAKSREAIGDKAGARADRDTGRDLERRAPGQ